jgi:hypothetical protein
MICAEAGSKLACQATELAGPAKLVRLGVADS